MSWLVNAWSQLWPNLLADALWAPAAGLFGWLYHRHLQKMHAKHQAEIRDIVKGEADAGHGN